MKKINNILNTYATLVQSIMILHLSWLIYTVSHIVYTNAKSNKLVLVVRTHYSFTKCNVTGFEYIAKNWNICKVALIMNDY